MGLTQEERQRIYEEEKARLEAQERLKAEHIKTPEEKLATGAACSMVAPYYIACAGILLILIFFFRSCALSVFGGPSVVANAVPDPVFAVPVGTVPVYRVVSGTPEQAGNARFLHARIVVPLGLSRADLEANIRHAAKYFYERDHPTGMFVFAYKEGTDTEGLITAGRCDFHPKSKDKYDPSLVLDDFAADVELVDGYFLPAGAEPKKNVTAGERALDEDFAKIDAQERKDEAKVNRRIPLRRRKQVYYAACKVLFDAMQSGSGSETKDRVAGVCHKYHISYDTEETIRQEGSDNGWPEPEWPVAPSIVGHTID